MHLKNAGKHESPKKPSYSDRYYTRFTINGKPIRISTGSTDLAEAERISWDLYQKALSDEGIDISKPDLTVDQVLASYTELEARYKESFKNFYKPKLGFFFKYFGKDRKWSSIADKDIAILIDIMRQGKVKIPITNSSGNITFRETKRNISVSTIKKYIIVLNSINNFVKLTLDAKAASFTTSNLPYFLGF